MIVEEQINPSIIFSLEEGYFNEELFLSFSDKIKDMIKKSEEYRKLVAKWITF